MKNIFYIDSLSNLMISLILFLGLIVFKYSNNYLLGDRNKKKFLANLIFLLCSVMLLVISNNFMLFLLGLGLSNFFISRLMLHKAEWEASKQSYILAFKNFSTGFVFLSLALALLYYISGKTMISELSASDFKLNNFYGIIISILITLAAFTQSAIIPFHRWLLSSMNSPTPASAIMHAGLISAGGFFILRFSPLFINNLSLLNVIFIFGIITAILGTIWKLMQTDIKRMLACSTIAQMGFMFAQCGLGLFASAVSHLIWHSLFKSYLFLSAGDFVKKNHKGEINKKYNNVQLILSGFCGFCCCYTFSFALGINFFANDTMLFIQVLVMVFGANVAFNLLRVRLKIPFVLVFLFTVICGLLYGFNISFIESFLYPDFQNLPIKFSMLHSIALIILIISLYGLNIKARSFKNNKIKENLFRCYVKLLNKSQPHPKTVSAIKGKYFY